MITIDHHAAACGVPVAPMVALRAASDRASACPPSASVRRLRVWGVSRSALIALAARTTARWSRRLVGAAVAAWVASGCAAPGATLPAPTPVIDGGEIVIPRPAVPLEVEAAVRAGSFARSRVNPRGVAGQLASLLSDSGIFVGVSGEGLEADVPAGVPRWELEVSGADFGTVGGYDLELQVLVLRDRRILATYRTEQRIRQPDGVTSQLVVGPPELGRLAERAIRDLVRQLAENADALRAL